MDMDAGRMRAIILKKGINADRTDLTEMITVELSDGNSASITLHPSTRGTTHYKDLVRIRNIGAQACSIVFKIDVAFKDPVREAQLIQECNHIPYS
jgi:hypothetical protein